MTMTDPVVIVAAKRTAIGNLGGGLSSLPAHELGACVISAVMEDAGLSGGDVDEVLMGQIIIEIDSIPNVLTCFDMTKVNVLLIHKWW